MKLVTMNKMFDIKTFQGVKKEPEEKPELEDIEDKHRDKFQVYDLRDSDLEEIDLSEFTNSVLFFSSGDFAEELKQFEEALDRQDGIFNMKPRKYFNFFVVTNNPCSPMLKEMVIREKNSLEQLKYPFPILLDVHGILGTLFHMFDDKDQKEVSAFVAIGIEGETLFEFELKNDENTASDMDIVAMMIKKCLE